MKPLDQERPHGKPQDSDAGDALKTARSAILDAQMILWCLLKRLSRKSSRVRPPTGKERLDAALRQFLNEDDTEQELPIANDNAVDEDDIPTVRIIRGHR